MRFLALDAISCSLWVLILSGVGYFFSGSIKTILGDYEKIGIALFFIVMTGVIVFYVVERYWLSDKVEEASPNTVQKIEEKILKVEEAGLGTLRDIGDRLHFTRDPHNDERPDAEPRAKKDEKTTLPH